jgi:pentatricopeptide repeat protein
MVHVAARQLYLHHGNRASADWIERAMKVAEPGTREYVILLSSAAVSALESGDATRAATLAEHAIEESNSVADIKAKMYAFIAAGEVEYQGLRFLTSFKYAKMAKKLAASIQDLPSEVCALSLLINGYSASGEPEAARTALHQMLEAAELLRDRFWLRIALYYISRVHIFAGRCSDALDASSRSSKLVNAPLWHQKEYLRVMHECGKYDEVIDKLDIIASQLPDSLGKPATLMRWWLYLPKLARIRRDTRHTDVVIAFSEKALRNRSISQHELWCLCLGIGLSATLRRDFVLAREMLKRLLEIRQQPEFTVSEEARTVGLVALTTGRWDIGIQYLAQALERHRSQQFWAEYAWDCYDLAAALRCWKVVNPCESVPGGEEYNEESLRREGCETATRLEMDPLLERYRLLDSAPEDPTAWQWKPAVGLMSGPTEDRKQRQNQEMFAALSSRESEVLTHVAAGKTNQEIGRDLYISEHTVANHVRRILKKLGLTNRIDAATYAVRHGLCNADNSFSSDE